MAKKKEIVVDGITYVSSDSVVKASKKIYLGEKRTL